MFDPFQTPRIYNSVDLSLMLAKMLDLHNGKAKYIHIFYLNIANDTCGCYDTECYLDIAYG